MHCPAFVFDAHELAVMKGRRPEEGEVDCAQHGLRRRQRGRRFGGQHREAAAHLGRAFPLRDEGDVLPGLKVRLHVARVAGFHFGAEHDRAEFARFVDVFLVFAFQVGVQFRGAHAGLQQDQLHACFLDPGGGRDDVYAPRLQRAADRDRRRRDRHRDGRQRCGRGGARVDQADRKRDERARQQ